MDLMYKVYLRDIVDIISNSKYIRKLIKYLIITLKHNDISQKWFKETTYGLHNQGIDLWETHLKIMLKK